MTKKCKKCNQEKSEKDFYGYFTCKECTKKHVRENREKNIEYYREYDRKRSSLPHRVKARKEISERWKTEPELKKRTCELKKRWSEENHLKRAAHIITGNAIRDGRLIKKPCNVCKSEKVEAHHDDYEKPLKVKWLCGKHHAEHHKKLREKERKCGNII